MKLFTLFVCLFSVTLIHGQEVDQVYYRSVVDNIIKRSCSKTPIPSKEILYEGDFIRVQTIKELYNAKPPYRNVQFTLVEDHGESIKVSAKGFCKVHLSIRRDWIQEGKNYAILKGGNCESVIEYRYKGNRITEAILYGCCKKSQL